MPHRRTNPAPSGALADKHFQCSTTYLFLPNLPPTCVALVFSCFLTPRRNCIRHQTQVALPFLWQPHLAELFKMGLHGPIHSEEVALQQPTQCGGSHFSHLWAEMNIRQLLKNRHLCYYYHFEHIQQGQVTELCPRKVLKKPLCYLTDHKLLLVYYNTLHKLIHIVLLQYKGTVT